MDSFRLNKIAGAVLGTLTVLLGVNVLVEEVFHEKKPAKPGMEVAVKEEGGKAAGGAAPAGAVALLASADPAKGEQAVKKCAACHSFGKGEPHKAGPNLFGIVGAKHGHEDDFTYSEPMKKSGGNWDFASLDKWLENPKGYIQGTSMSFAGVKDNQERANIIAYLNKNSDSPQPLPKPGEGGAPAAGAAAPAGGAAGGGFAAKVASADPAKGEQASKKCAACHDFTKGGPAKAGPNLYGIVGLKHAHMEGFGYSDAMKKTSDKVWDIENLNKWLENPKGYVPGTSMAFAGIKNEDERANLIAYLNKNSDNPQKLEGAAPAGGDKKAEAPAAAAPAKPEAAQSEPAKPEAAKPANEQAGGGAEADKATQPAPAASAPAAPAGGSDEPVEKRLASADPAKGEAFFKQNCGVCHTSEKGGEAGAGPNLYGVVGLKHGHMEGFEYSDALKGKQGNWDFAQLDEWLTDPAKYAPGNMMPYPGIKDAQERADVIAFLNKNSDNPAPIPGK